MLDVLPRALVAAASGVRAFAREVEPVPAAAVGDAVLTDALRAFCAAWGATATSLSSAADRCAEDLETGAAQYVHVESLLVPVALR